MPDILVEEVLNANLELAPVISASLAPTIELNGEISRDASVNYYTGAYTVTPQADSEVVLPTKMKMLTDDVTVFKVPYFETSNQYGDTVYIASEA